MTLAIVSNILLILLNSLYAVAKKKKNSALLAVSFIVLFLLMAGYRGSFSGTGLSRDMYNYMRLYDRIQSGGVSSSFEEPGFVLLNAFFANILNVDFLIFYGTMHSMCLFTIFYMMKRFCRNPHVGIALFSSLFLVYCCEQFQNYISLVIATYGFCELITAPKEGVSFKYIIIIAIASMIHYTSALYMVFLLINIKNKKLLIKIVACITILLIVIQGFTGSRFNLNIVMESRLNDALRRYNTSAHFGYLYGVFIQMTGIAVSYWNKKLCVENGTFMPSQCLYTYDFLDKILWLNILAVIFIPLYMINTQSIRLARGLLLLNFFGCANVLPILKLKGRFDYMIFYLIWIMVVMFTIICLLNGSYESVLIPFYEMNAFFSK